MSGHSGVYQLWIHLPRPVSVTIGRLGRIAFEPGTYVYTGSAKHGLTARIERHRRHRKVNRWHIDYLLAVPGVRLIDVKTRPWQPNEECRWCQQTRRRLRARIPAPGFGSSDCRWGCGAHLLCILPRRT